MTPEEHAEKMQQIVLNAINKVAEMNAPVPTPIEDQKAYWLRVAACSALAGADMRSKDQAEYAFETATILADLLFPNVELTGAAPTTGGESDD